MEHVPRGRCAAERVPVGRPRHLRRLRLPDRRRTRPRSRPPLLLAVARVIGRQDVADGDETVSVEQCRRPLDLVGCHDLQPRNAVALTEAVAQRGNSAGSSYACVQLAERGSPAIRLRCSGVVSISTSPTGVAKPSGLSLYGSSLTARLTKPFGGTASNRYRPAGRRRSPVVSSSLLEPSLVRRASCPFRGLRPPRRSAMCDRCRCGVSAGTRCVVDRLGNEVTPPHRVCQSGCLKRSKLATACTMSIS